MSADAARTPLARGSLFDTPLCHLVLYLNRHAHGGTLIASGHELGEAMIRFQRGRPTAARLPWSAPSLLEGLLPLCALAQGEFSFYEDDLLGERADTLNGIVDPYELLTAALDGYTREDMVDAVLARFAGRTLRMLPGREIERLRLRPEHAPLIELIRAAPATADELIAQAPLPPLQVRRLLYALIAANVVSAHEQRDSASFRSQVEPTPSRPAAISSSMPAARPQPTPSRPAGISSSIPAARPASVSHPAPGPRSGAPAAGASGRPMAAWQQLASLRPGGMSMPPRNSAQPPASARSQVSVRPSSVAPEDEDRDARIKRIELLMQRSRSDEAVGLVDGMLASDPYDAELLAVRAHVLFEKHQVNDEGLPRFVLEAIRRALESGPDEPRALFVKGLVCKRAGDLKKAALYFRRVLQLDPKHIDAQRELRLAKLRE